MTSSHVSSSSRWVYALIFHKGRLIIGSTDGGLLAIPGGRLLDIDNLNPDAALQRICRQQLGLNVTLRQLAQPKVGGIDTREFRKVNLSAMPSKIILQSFYVLEATEYFRPRAPYEQNFRTPSFMPLSALKDHQKRYDLKHTLQSTVDYFQQRGLVPPPAGLETVPTDFGTVAKELARLQFHASTCRQVAGFKPLGEYKPAKVLQETSHRAAL